MACADTMLRVRPYAREAVARTHGLPGGISLWRYTLAAAATAASEYAQSRFGC